MKNMDILPVRRTKRILHSVSAEMNPARSAAGR